MPVEGGSAARQILLHGVFYLCDSEVNEFDLVSFFIFQEKNIGWLDVPMENAIVMGVAHPLANLLKKRNRLA